MKFKYIGDPDRDGNGPSDGTNEISLFGYKFQKGRAVEVKDDDENAIAKLTGNSHFEEVATRAAKQAKDTADG